MFTKIYVEALLRDPILAGRRSSWIDIVNNC
jgi:hypothetical protein